jgi:riboflavin synthase
MFTGIIESLGRVEGVVENGHNRSFWISSPISHELKIDQSLSHNGICLTVEAKTDEYHQVTAVAETLEKTNASVWKIGDLLNLERAMTMQARLDGHMVQGHVDATAKCTGIVNMEGSWKISFKFPQKFQTLMIEKGSVCVNGISLTAFDVTENCFSVAIIPYTWEHTNLKTIHTGDDANIEFDMIGKYVERYLLIHKIMSNK